MAYEFVIGRLQEYAREQREREIKEARELQLKQLEAEHLEAVRLERKKNWIIEPPDSGFKSADVPVTINQSMDKERDGDLREKSVSNPTRTRKINLVRAIESAVSKLRISLGKKPSMDELWRYFGDELDETGFIVDFNDTHLIWVDTRGRFKNTKKSTVENHLAKIKS